MPKHIRQKKPKGSGATAGDHISDPRFTNIQTDPRFRLPSKQSTHVRLDKRFAHMLRDEDFSSRAKVDRYGRKLPKDAGRKELERYYNIEEEDRENLNDEDDEVERELERLDREDEDISSSEDSISSDDDGELRFAEEEEIFGLLDNGERKDGAPQGEISSRIAVVNLDWDNIRAADLMAVFSSFVSTGGRIKKISVYPSEFGRERMEREEMEGPPKEIFEQNKTNSAGINQSHSSEEDEYDVERSDDEENDEEIKKSILKEDQGQEFNSAKLRRYQLERLRYYYAVLDCSSISVAQAIYDAVDGTEYLTTANFFDLRYIPDEVDFSHDKPRDECERIPDRYRPNEFVTDALQHSKVRLTWDADDGTRKEAQKRAFTGSRADIDENDLKAYLGSDSSDDEDPEPITVDAVSGAPKGNDELPKVVEGLAPKLSKKDAERHKMRSLLGLAADPSEGKKSKADKNAPSGDMQITFSSGFSTEPNKGSVFENEPEREETTVEKYVRKEKERKGRRREKTKSSRGGANPSQTLVKDKPASDEPSDAADPRAPQDLGFSDPFFTDPSNVRPTTASHRKAEKKAKLQQREAEEAASAAKRAELSLLMQEDNGKDPTAKMEMHHFDINEIAKAEKVLSKKKKKGRKLTQREKEALEAKEKDDFKIDVRDERFRDVFERVDFAIDPSHPRFKGTEGMRELLEEGRRKRKVPEDNEEKGENDESQKREGGVKRARRRDGDERIGNGDGDGGNDVQRLVARVKRKPKKIMNVDQ